MSGLLKLNAVLLRNTNKCFKLVSRPCSVKKVDEQNSLPKFETVFSFPSIGYISLINRLKVYHAVGASIAIPSIGALQMLNVISDDVLLPASYIGITGAIVLSIASLPFRNIIGHLYISEDNKQIKISSCDFWGRRQDRIIAAEEWIPLFDLPAKNSDAIFLSPQLTDGTKYRLLVKYGIVYNSKKMGEVLE